MLYCLRSIAVNSSGPPEEFCETVFISSMMSSLVILFACGCQMKSFGYLIVIFGSGVLKYFVFFLIAAIALVSLRFISVFI